MKKSLIITALVCGISGAFAQDLTSKKGEPILPEAEDWAISMDVNPIFQYVGNAFSGATATNASPSVNFLNSNNTIIGKQFIDETSAYRVLVRLGFTNQTYKNLVGQDNQTAPTFPTLPTQVEDKFKSRSTNIAIGVGKEMRRGKTRLQGYYGADAMIWIAMSSQKYEYGNTMGATAAGSSYTPTSTTWNTTTGAVTGTSTNGSRALLAKSGMTFGIGVRGFIGAEYFIFPKIAIGAEYGWGIGFQLGGKSKTTTEVNNGTSVAEQEVEGAGSSKFGFDTDINQNNIFGFKGSNTGNLSLRATFHF